MLKKTTLLLFFVSISFSQNNLAVTYKVKIEDEKDLFSSNTTLRNYFVKAIQNSPLLEFKLICKKDMSKFYDSTIFTNLDLSQKQTLLSFSSYSGIIYDEKKFLYKQSMILGNNIFLKKEKKNDWVLQNETKEINGFLCYKATSTNKIVYGEKVFNHPVTAWYCPTLPYNFGPNGYSGLPGLILELNDGNISYVVKKINLSKNKTVIEIPKGKTMSEEEYLKKIKERFGY